MIKFKEYYNIRESKRPAQDLVAYFTGPGQQDPWDPTSAWGKIAEGVHLMASKGHILYEKPLHFSVYAKLFEGWDPEDFRELYNGVTKGKIIPAIKIGLMYSKDSFERQKSTLKPDMLGYISKDLKKLEAMYVKHYDNEFDLVPPEELMQMWDLIKQMKKDGLHWR